jgi:hypothetical protein
MHAGLKNPVIFAQHIRYVLSFVAVYVLEKILRVISKDVTPSYSTPSLF